MQDWQKVVKIQKREAKSEVSSTISTQVEETTKSSSEDVANLETFQFDEVMEFIPKLSELSLVGVRSKWFMWNDKDKYDGGDEEEIF